MSNICANITVCNVFNFTLRLGEVNVFLETRVVSNLLLAIKNISKDPTQLKLETDASGKQMLTRIFMFLNYIMYTDTGHIRLAHHLFGSYISCVTPLLHILAIFILIATQIPDNALVVTSVLQYDQTLSNIKNIPTGDILDKVTALVQLIPALSEL
ncbi:hypothetical protein WDU94_008796 [Cyamophila willieti]